jgi:hypothetical protein
LAPEFGEACYAAPETFERECSSASDVYSFALILYELTTAQRVFAKETPLATLPETGRQETPAGIPERVSPTVRRVTTQGWAAKPSVPPSFDQILTVMRDIQFQIAADVQWNEIADFVPTGEFGPDNQAIE